ncbi:PDZ domain-containing protein [Bacillus solitudinis]|uniref:PDZ domain-containing protein n=1 Tax=Bacillus solitudinis TaxID=2014074 RepID=UPI000C24DD2D|nr:PDZ domain-containing protein [Bacillus solitudinis]
MIVDILKSIGLAFGSFFVHPLLYIGLFVIFLMSKRRVRKERLSFHTRVYSLMADFVIPFGPAIITGSLISIFLLGLGVVVTLPLLIVIAIVYLLAILTAQVRWMSPAFVLGFVLILFAIEPFAGYMSGFGGITDLYLEAAEVPIVHIAILLAALVIAEGWLIEGKGASYTSPRLKRSKRGKWIGFHDVRRLWIVPVCLFVPEGVIPSFEFWPVFSLGETSLQPLIIPFLIGFQQSVRSTLPRLAIRLMGQRVLGLGVLFAILAVLSYYQPVVALILGTVAILGRELLWVLAKHRDEARPSLFAVKPSGCIVLGVIPGSPAEKMKIQVGEVIVKVNGEAVNDEISFYKALQKNSAFCKLDVLDEAGEVRFAQGALYDGGHHHLGILVVKKETKLQDSII